MKKLTKTAAAKLIVSRQVKVGMHNYYWNNAEAHVFNTLGTDEEAREAYEIARETFNNVPWNATKAERIEAICRAVNAA